MADKGRRAVAVATHVGIGRCAGIDVAVDLLFENDVVPFTVRIQDVIELAVQLGCQLKRNVSGSDVARRAAGRGSVIESFQAHSSSP